MGEGRRRDGAFPREMIRYVVPCVCRGGSAQLAAALRGFATDVEYRDRAPVDAHFVSNAPDVTLPGRLYRRFEVAVGSAIRVAVPSAVSTVDVKVGHLEEIGVEVG